MGFVLILVFPAGSAQGFNIARTKAIMDLGLDEKKTLALRPVRIGPKRTQIEDNAARDRWVLALSHRMIAICVRSGGNLDGYLKSAQLPQEATDRRFQTVFVKPPSLKKALIPKKIHVPDWYRPEDYLIHWTRSCVGPWPGESHAEHFSRLMKGQQETEGLDTLKRILKEGVIRASTRLVRGGYPVVPFTENPPQDLPGLMRWRSGLRRWTFEPYGIALSKARLVESGARPVIYGEIADFERLPQEERPFFQLAKSGVGDWTQEMEWRILGDLNLEAFETQELALLLPSQQEAISMSKTCPWRVIALGHAESR